MHNKILVQRSSTLILDIAHQRETGLRRFQAERHKKNALFIGYYFYGHTSAIRDAAQK